MQNASQSSPSPLSPALSIIHSELLTEAPNPSKPPPRSSESPTEPEPARTQRTRKARSLGGAVLCFGAMLSFPIYVRASGVQRPHQEKEMAEHVLGLFWVLVRLRTSGSSLFLWGPLFPTPRLPAKGARRGGRPRSLRQEPRLDAAPPRRRRGPRRVRGLPAQGGRQQGAPPPLPGWLRQGSGRGRGKFQGPGGRRRRKQGVPSIPCTESRALELRIAVLQIPSNGLCRHVLLPS